MSDQRLRDLERRWKSSGAIDDEAAYLLELQRAGEIQKAKLNLLASCGFAPALIVTQSQCDDAQLPNIIAGFDSKALIRTAFSFAELPLQRWESSRPNFKEPRGHLTRAVRLFLRASIIQSVGDAAAIHKWVRGMRNPRGIERVAIATDHNALSILCIVRTLVQRDVRIVSRDVINAFHFTGEIDPETRNERLRRDLARWHLYGEDPLPAMLRRLQSTS